MKTTKATVPNIIIGIEDFPAFDFEKPKEDTVCVVTHRMPSFPGGYDSLTAFIRRNTRYPSQAEQENIRGVTCIKCVIDKKETSSDPKLWSHYPPNATEKRCASSEACQGGNRA